MAETTPYVKQTHTTSFTSANANYMEEGIRAAHEQPAVHVYHNTTQAPTSGVETALVFNSERFDTAFGSASTQHDTGSNTSRLTCRYAGIYAVQATFEFTANATGSRYGFLRVNATASQRIGLERKPANGSVAATVNVYALIQLAVNDYVEVFAYQDSGSGLNVTASSATTQYGAEFQMVRVA